MLHYPSARKNLHGVIKDLLCDIKVSDEETLSYLCILLEEGCQNYDDHFCKEVLDTLEKIAGGNKNVIYTLLSLLTHGKLESDTRKKIELTLEKLMTKEMMPQVIATTKHRMVHISSIENYKSCHQILFYCAKSLSYTEFHTEWHKP
jgi:hypothetical protein